jgi:hypothetical protein
MEWPAGAGQPPLGTDAAVPCIQCGHVKGSRALHLSHGSLHIVHAQRVGVALVHVVLFWVATIGSAISPVHVGVRPPLSCMPTCLQLPHILPDHPQAIMCCYGSQAALCTAQPPEVHPVCPPFSSPLLQVHPAPPSREVEGSCLSSAAT